MQQIPINLLLSKSRVLNLTNDPILDGIAPRYSYDQHTYQNTTNEIKIPFILLLFNSKFVNFVIDPILDGIVPKALNPKSNINNIKTEQATI